MKPILLRLLAVTTLVVMGGCAHNADTARTRTQDNFGVQMARMDLWREAMFRFRRAVEINPQDAQAHNNLAVAYEANGEFEKARKEYLEALKLDRSNQYIQKNYSRFVEFLSRNRKRQPGEGQTAAAKPATTPAASVTQAEGTHPAASQPPRPSPGVPPPPIAPPTTANPDPTPPPPGDVP